MACTIGCNSDGALSRFTARTPRTKLAHCQSQFACVGKSARAGCFTSHHRPSIASSLGFIRRFQKTGTLLSGGHVSSSADVGGENRTLPPLLRRNCDSFQSVVSSTSFGTAVSALGRYSQRFQSF